MHNPLTATCPRLGTVKTTTARARETNETSCSNTDCESVHGWRSAVVRETGRWGGVCTHRHTHTASTLLIELASAYTPARARVCVCVFARAGFRPRACTQSDGFIKAVTHATTSEARRAPRRTGRLRLCHLLEHVQGRRRSRLYPQKGRGKNTRCRYLLCQYIVVLVSACVCARG